MNHPTKTELLRSVRAILNESWPGWQAELPAALPGGDDWRRIELQVEQPDGKRVTATLLVNAPRAESIWQGE